MFLIYHHRYQYPYCAQPPCYSTSRFLKKQKRSLPSCTSWFRLLRRRFPAFWSGMAITAAGNAYLFLAIISTFSGGSKKHRNNLILRELFPEKLNPRRNSDNVSSSWAVFLISRFPVLLTSCPLHGLERKNSCRLSVHNNIHCFWSVRQLIPLSYE